MAAVYDVLLRWDSETKEVVPQLAKSLQPNDEFTTWTLKLRDGVTFSDGTPLDAAAVKWSLQRYVEKRGPYAQLWADNVTAVQTPDAHTVIFELATSWPGLKFLLTSGFGMIVAQSAVAGETFTPVGAGAFAFVRHSPHEAIVLEANENYWDGRPNLDSVRVVFLDDQHAVVDSLNSGGIDMGFLRDPDLVDETLAAGNPGYLDMAALGNVAVINASEGHPGTDPRVRKAMQMAINPEVIQQRVYGGAGVASSAIYPEYSRWHTDVESLPYDPEQATKLLEQAKADGFDGLVTYTDGQDPSSRAAALAVKASLEAVGFTVGLDMLRSVDDQVRKVEVEQNYDVAGYGMSWREAGPYVQMFSTLHSQGTDTVGMATGPDMDGLIAEFQKAATEGEKREIMDRIQAKWNELVPALVFGPTPTFVAWPDRIHGVDSNWRSVVLLDDAWVAPAG